MALFERSPEEETDNLFPTDPAFLVPVEVRDAPQYGPGHRGVFAAAPILAGTKFWLWTDRVERIHRDGLEACLAERFPGDEDAIRLFLRQGFVLPGPEAEDYFCSNPTDAGRFMNHSDDPNCGPDGTLRDVDAGEELTMDYGFHGDPVWYREVCRRYGVKTEAEIARQSREGAKTLGEAP